MSGGLVWAEGETVALVGPFAPSLAGSELAKQRGELDLGLPEPDIKAVRAACVTVRDAVRAGTIDVAHDISDGGLACALAELAIASGVGVRGSVEFDGSDEALFGEGSGGFVVAGEKAAIEALGAPDVEVRIIGTVGGDSIELEAGSESLNVALDAARDAFFSFDKDL